MIQNLNHLFNKFVLILYLFFTYSLLQFLNECLIRSKFLNINIQIQSISSQLLIILTKLLIYLNSIST